MWNRIEFVREMRWTYWAVLRRILSCFGMNYETFVGRNLAGFFLDCLEVSRFFALMESTTTEVISWFGCCPYRSWTTKKRRLIWVLARRWFCSNNKVIYRWFFGYFPWCNWSRRWVIFVQTTNLILNNCPFCIFTFTSPYHWDLFPCA